ncbi:MAG: hypothetical protein Q9227_001693 [Pyrenula ochraceoflavens]
MAELVRSSTSESKEWESVVKKVRKSICMIRVTCEHSVNDTPSSAWTGTGFLIDFEIKVRYADPIHDFSVLEVQNFTSLSFGELSLEPNEAFDGCEICLVGVDSEMRAFTGRATIRNTNCNPPDSVVGDFNTTYISADAKTTTWDSPGTPAVNIDGQVVGLSCGVLIRSSVRLLLPLNAPLRTLRLLRQKEQIHRGTVQIKWIMKPLNECRRLGLPHWKEQAFRAVKRDSAIVAEVVLPKGPAERHLEPGDILLSVNAEWAPDLFRLEEYMNLNVGGTLRFRCWRRNQELDFDIQVQDLHDVTPSRLITRAGACFHLLAYSQAIRFVVPAEGVYVSSGSSGFMSHHLVTSINGRAVSNLDGLIAVIDGLKVGTHIVTCHKKLEDLKTPISNIGFISCWPSRGPNELNREPRQGGGWTENKASLQSLILRDCGLDYQQPQQRMTRLPVRGDNVPSRIREIFRSVVAFECYNFVPIEGQNQSRQLNFGLIVDMERGFIVAPRFNANLFSEISILTANSIATKAHIVYVHHTTNLVVIKFEPSIFQGNMQAASFTPSHFQKGEKFYYVGFDLKESAAVKTTVESLRDVTIFLHGSAPHFRPFTFEHCQIDTAISRHFRVGALLNTQGAVIALQFLAADGPCYIQQFPLDVRGDFAKHCTISAKCILTVVSDVQNGKSDAHRFASFDIIPLTTFEATAMGAPLGLIYRRNVFEQQFHGVYAATSTSPTESDKVPELSLRKGDIILALDDKPVTKMADLPCTYTQDRVVLRILRHGQESTVIAPTLPAWELDIDYAIQFCGAWLHKPHLAALQTFNPVHSQVYITTYECGSPAQLYGVPPQAFVCAVDGFKVITMADFRDLILRIPDRTEFTLKGEAQSDFSKLMLSIKVNSATTAAKSVRKPLAMVESLANSFITEDDDD